MNKLLYMELYVLTRYAYSESGTDGGLEAFSVLYIRPIS